MFLDNEDLLCGVLVLNVFNEKLINGKSGYTMHEINDINYVMSGEILFLQ